MEAQSQMNVKREMFSDKIQNEMKYQYVIMTISQWNLETEATHARQCIVIWYSAINVYNFNLVKKMFPSNVQDILFIIFD